MSWSLEDGYAAKSGTKAYPRRVLAGDNDESFHVLVKARLIDNDPGCSGKSEGFKVYTFSCISKKKPYKFDTFDR